MACQITGRSKVVVSQAVHPHYRQALRTYLWTNSRQLVEVPAREGITDLDALTAALDARERLRDGAVPELLRRD